MQKQISKSFVVKFPFISLIFARHFQDVSISAQIFQKTSLTFQEFFSFISLTLYDFPVQKGQDAQYTFPKFQSADISQNLRIF